MRVHGLLVNLLCSIVVVANTQTIPYLSFLGNNLSNHSYVNFSTVGNENDSIQCHTDLVTCCNSDQGMDRGDWFYPDAERVSNNSDSEPFYQHWANQSVDLRYRGVPAVPSIMGIYQCAIETIKVNNENNTARQVLYVGLYNSTGGDLLIMGDKINFIKSSDINGTAQFTLTCISTGGPATTVTWTRDSILITNGYMTHTIDDRETSQYTHTLTFNISEALEGIYRCTVLNNKPSEASAELMVQVANVILELTITRSGLYTVLVSWTPSSGDTAKVTGYILYYQQHGGHRFQMSLAASDNSTTVQLPTLGVTYIFTIVATSIHLPSPESDPVMFTLEMAFIFISILAPETPVTPTHETVVISCFVYVETGVDVKVTFKGPGAALLSVSTDITEQNTSTKVELHDIQGSEMTDRQYNCTVELNNSIYSAYITFESRPEDRTCSRASTNNIPLYGGTAGGIILFVTITVFCAVMVVWKKHRKYKYFFGHTGTNVGDKELSDVTVFPNMSYRNLQILSPNTTFTDSDNGSYDSIDTSNNFPSATTHAALPNKTSDNPRSRGLSESYVPCTPPLNNRIPPPVTGTDRSRGFSESYVPCTPPLNNRIPPPVTDTDRSRGLSESYVPCTPPPNNSIPPPVTGLTDGYVVGTAPSMHQSKHQLPMQLHDTESVHDGDKMEDKYYNLRRFTARSLPSLHTLSTSPVPATRNNDDSMPDIMPYFARITIKPYPQTPTTN